MVWEPIALALVFGLLISATIYFIFFWPSVDEELEADSLDGQAVAIASANEADEPSVSN